MRSGSFTRAVIFGAAVLSAFLALFVTACGGVPSDAAATVNGVVIKKDDVEDRIRIARGLTPQNVPSDTSSQDYNNLQRDVTEQLVNEEEEKQETQKRGITVAPEEIDAAFEQVLEDKYLGSVDKMREDFDKRGMTEEDLRGQILRQLLHVKLLDSLRAEVPVTEDEVRARYESNIANYVTPERRQVRQIVVADEATARSVANRIAAGEDFVTLAGQISIDARTKQNGGMVGLVAREALPQEVGDAAFSLDTGQVSPPIQASQGWTIIKVEFISPAQNQTFDDVKDELTKFMGNHKLAERYKTYVEEVKSSYDVKFADNYSPRERTSTDVPATQPSVS